MQNYVNCEVPNPNQNYEVSNPNQSYEVSNPNQSYEVSNTNQSYEVSNPNQSYEVFNPNQSYEVSNPNHSYEVSNPNQSLAKAVREWLWILLSSVEDDIQHGVPHRPGQGPHGQHQGVQGEYLFRRVIIKVHTNS